MPKLTKKAIRYGRTDGRTYGRTDPNYRKASLLKILLFFYNTKQLDVCPSVRLSVRLKLKISVTTEPIGFCSFWNIPTGPVVVLGYFPVGGTPQPPKNLIKD